MKVKEMVALYQEQVEAEYGLELAAIQAAKIANPYPIEKYKAICNLEQEIISTINEQVLLQWLIDNSILEELYEEYAFFGNVLYFRGEAVENE